MKCEDAKDLFLAYHDGDLSPLDNGALEEHLAGCDACQSDWEAYRITLGEVSGMFRVAPPDGFTQRVKQTIGKRSKGRFFGDDRHLSVSFAIVSFLLIVLVLLAYIFISSSREIEVVSPSESGQNTSDDNLLEKDVPPDQ